MPDELVTIASFVTAPEAHEARIELESEGIEAIVADETLVTLAFPGTVGIGGVKLQVKASDVEQATRLLERTPAAKDLVIDLGEEASTDEEPS